MHIFDADGAGVRVAQYAENVAQLQQRLARETAGGKLAIKVPERQIVGQDVEIWMRTLLVFEWIGIGHEMTAYAIGVDNFLHTDVLVEVRLMRGGNIVRPADRLVGNAKRLEDVVVEAVLTKQEGVDTRQKVARLSALDDAVVVGRRKCEDLRHGIAHDRLGGGALPFGWVFKCARADDAALALHESRHRVNSADGARIGEADRGAYEVIHTEFVVACSADEIFVGRVEHREVHRLGGFDAGHHQRARSIRLLEIDREAEVHVRRSDHGGLAVNFGERVVHCRLCRDCLDDCVADNVRERHLAATSTCEMAIDHVAVVREQFCGHRTNAGGCWHAETGFHVLHESR